MPEIRAGKVAAFSIDVDGEEVLVLAAEARAIVEAAARVALAAAIGDTILSQHGLEATVVLLPANTLPYTSSGKLSRSETRSRYVAGMLAAEPAPA